MVFSPPLFASETWVDQFEGEDAVYGVDTIVKDRWNLVSPSTIRRRDFGSFISFQDLLNLPESIGEKTWRETAMLQREMHSGFPSELR